MEASLTAGVQKIKGYDECVEKVSNPKVAKEKFINKSGTKNGKSKCYSKIANRLPLNVVM